MSASPRLEDPRLLSRMSDEARLRCGSHRCLCCCSVLEAGNLGQTCVIGGLFRPVRHPVLGAMISGSRLPDERSVGARGPKHASRGGGKLDSRRLKVDQIACSGMVSQSLEYVNHIFEPTDIIVSCVHTPETDDRVPCTRYPHTPFQAKQKQRGPGNK